MLAHYKISEDKAEFTYQFISEVWKPFIPNKTYTAFLIKRK